MKYSNEASAYFKTQKREVADDIALAFTANIQQAIKLNCG